MSYGTREDYERAEQFLPKNAESLVRNDDLEINWIDDQDRFWYRRDTRDGATFIDVNLVDDTVAPAFDHEHVASALSRTLGTTYTADELPFEEFEYGDDEATIRFTVDGTRFECELSAATGVEPVTASSSSSSTPSTSISPDGRWAAFIRDNDLYVRETTHGSVLRLTNDGEERYSYATPLRPPTELLDEDPSSDERPIDVQWSPDSRRLMTYRLDRRNATELALVQSTPDDQVRPKCVTYTYPLPGEVGLPVAEPIVFDIERRTQTPLDVDPIPILYYGSGPLFDWIEDGEHLTYYRRSRGFSSAQYIEANATSGASRVVFEDESDTVVDPYLSDTRAVDDGDRILVTSERSGWNHLYLVDGDSGEFVCQLTSGDWVVREVGYVDEEQQRVYFAASDREGDCDPYLRRWYRVNFDGSELTLLTPEPADHSVTISASGTYFVDSYSRVDEPPVTVVRRCDDGGVVKHLETADIDQLADTGWTAPTPFTATAADGETDLYGVMWRPSTFDPSAEYPVVEHVYTGPHDAHVPKRFDAYRSNGQAIAELGFIVVMIDGRGTGRRSKAFRDRSHKNLSRIGLEDHRAAIEQLAETHSHIDGSRVGIYGHSAGGYDAANALMRQGEFYDVAVSSSGNHDHRLDKASWNELWMGYPLDDHYETQSNVAFADRLEGKLLLVHGELDQNVPPAATRRLVNALIEANKDFDLLILPNRTHDLSDDRYFHRRRWDYFVRHLHGVEPPAEYEIDTYR
ncbi:S9 family peptidase [Natrononativus amylolyticus]|uniref:S9 family peptidase n=1 Tax=Natrononativus amylolyticus TaxID=2963434 RepID=UPI0020CB9602|nr:DPP IV N-terminal domain-containing protein [Natrononativus amylolyticus]